MKICCITSWEEAWLAVRSGADALGFVSEMPSGPGVIADALIAEIAARVPPGVESFLLTCCQSAAGIIEQHRRLRTGVIQICDRLTEGGYLDLREALPGAKLVQVIHVSDEASVDEALSVAHDVDAILLDSGNRKLAVRELGGTGRRHDWQISRRIREAAPVPVYLAGGLTPDNVEEAIEAVEPFGLDVCTGVRVAGRLDRQRLDKFFDSVRGYASCP